MGSIQSRLKIFRIFAQQQNASFGEDSFVGSAVLAHESVDGAEISDWLRRPTAAQLEVYFV